MEQAECTYRSGYLYPTDTRRRIFPSFLISHLAKAALVLSGLRARASVPTLLVWRETRLRYLD